MLAREMNRETRPNPLIGPAAHGRAVRVAPAANVRRGVEPIARPHRLDRCSPVAELPRIDFTSDSITLAAAA
jgi:hypothetical protein